MALLLMGGDQAVQYVNVETNNCRKYEHFHNENIEIKLRYYTRILEGLKTKFKKS